MKKYTLTESVELLNNLLGDLGDTAW